MSAKIEVIGDAMRGPYTVKINDTIVEFVEDYELVYDQREGVNRLKLVILTDNFQLRGANNESIESK